MTAEITFVPQPEDSGSQLRCEAINEAVDRPVVNVITIDVATTTTSTTTTTTTTTTSTTTTTTEMYYDEVMEESRQSHVFEKFEPSNDGIVDVDADVDVIGDDDKLAYNDESKTGKDNGDKRELGQVNDS